MKSTNCRSQKMVFNCPIYHDLINFITSKGSFVKEVLFFIVINILLNQTTKSMKSFCIVLFLQVLLFQYLFAQNSTGFSRESTVSILPVSPEAASLQKFSEIPVSNYTGIPQISIPIYTVQKGDIVVDIAMSYHAGGNKVDDIASRVGLGWALNASGTITRSARGRPDDILTLVDVNRYINNQMAYQERMDYLYNVHQGIKDAEPDIYYLSLRDINCKMFKGLDGAWVTMPKSENIKVQEAIEGFDWIITDGSGVKYKFKDRELTESSVTTIFSTHPANTSGYSSEISSWLLTEIEDSRGNNVKFFYQNHIQNFVTKGGETISVPKTLNIDCNKSTIFSYSENTVMAKRLSEIRFSDGEIHFRTAGEQRTDLPGDSSLSSIEIYNSHHMLKRFKLFTSYFENNGTGVNTPMIFRPMDHYRLRLDSLKEESNGIILPAYKFIYYYGNGLPSRNSHAQDHWGFFNGSDNYGTSVSYIEFGRSAGAKKKVNPQYTKETILTDIIYPSGGKVSYNYEGNTYRSLRNIDGDEEEIYLGGLSGTNSEPGATVDGLNYSYSKSFVVTPEQLVGGPMKVRSKTDVDGYDSQCSCSINVSLRKPDNSLMPIRVNTEESFLITEPGTYTIYGDITVEFHMLQRVYFATSLIGKIAVVAGLNTYNGPGLRIKKIKREFSPTDILWTSYDYNDPKTSESSGKVSGLPNYTRDIRVENEHYYCDNVVYSSGSNYTLINTKGSYVGYTDVTVMNGLDGVQGKTTYRYSYADDINNESYAPFPPNSPQDWKRGLPIEESIFKYANGSFELQLKKRYSYNIFSGSLTRAFGIKIGANTVYNFPTGTNIIVNGLTAVAYPIDSDAFLLSCDTLITYSNQGNTIASNAYIYSPLNYKLKEQRSFGSNGLENRQKYYYAQDYYLNNASSLLLSGMLEKNLVNLPIQETSSIIRNGVEHIRSGIVYEYDFGNISGQSFKPFYLKGLYEADIETTLVSDHYDFLNIPTSYIKRLSNQEINGLGKPVFQKKNTKQKTIYIYSYNREYIIAEIKNVDYSAVLDILTESGISVFEKILKPSDAQIINFLAPLRVNLPDAYITSYTYKPLVGMTSMTDAKGMTTYYEYDAFQRLKTIKDQNGNILKQTDYHYKN
ncbi:hypothetical protein [Pedobacter terrae]|uniref:hypothetical protein n=1 Tax=Pedobacter terrae TaxID=405671 RepID=UPI002FF77C11